MSNTTKMPTSPKTSGLRTAAIEFGAEVAMRLAEDALIHLGKKMCSQVKHKPKSKLEEGEIKN